jgi:hypothetical protein
LASFVPTVDSRRYSKLLSELAGKSAVCYKSIAPLSEAEWLNWLAEVGSLVPGPHSRTAAFCVYVLVTWLTPIAFAGYAV